MGKLRTVPKSPEPGFISFQVEDDFPAIGAQSEGLSLQTRKGTTIAIPADMSLRQVARLVKMLEGK